MLNLTEKYGLFEHFEVNSEPFWPRISRLLGGSVVLHLILAACIIFIPPVRDALSIALVLSGGRFVDRPYTKTQIENEGDIVELATEKFHYPEGYFAMDQLPVPTPTPIGPAFTPRRTFQPKEEAPSPTPSPVAAATPSPLAKASPAITPTPSAEDEKEKKKIEEELDRLAAENGVKRPKEINTRPFKDLLAEAKKRKDRGELNLDGQIELTVEADRSDDGKLLNAQVKDKRGDKKLEAIALNFVSALSDSGVLDFLEGTKHLKLTVKIDDKTVEVNASSEVESEERARTMERTFNGMIVLGRIAKRGKDEEIYYNHTEVNSNQKEVSVKFSIARSEISQMLSKYAAEK